MNTLTVAGDSVGGNMSIAMTLMSKFRNGPKLINNYYIILL